MFQPPEEIKHPFCLFCLDGYMTLRIDKKQRFYYHCSECRNMIWAYTGCRLLYRFSAMSSAVLANLSPERIRAFADQESTKAYTRVPRPAVRVPESVMKEQLNGAG
jgi:hypothetical protein